MSVGVDAHIDPAVCSRRIARIFGENEKRSVGADASVRPWGNGKFAATLRKNGRAACGSMRVSTPTNVLRVCIGAFVFAGAYRRADRVVRPYECVRVCIGAFKFATSYRAGGASPAPTLRRNALQLRNKNPSPHPSRCASHLPRTGKAFCVLFLTFSPFSHCRGGEIVVH